jgi:hypothetical protein
LKRAEHERRPFASDGEREHWTNELERVIAAIADVPEHAERDRDGFAHVEDRRSASGGPENRLPSRNGLRNSVLSP